MAAQFKENTPVSETELYYAAAGHLEAVKQKAMKGKFECVEIALNASGPTGVVAEKKNAFLRIPGEILKHDPTRSGQERGRIYSDGNGNYHLLAPIVNSDAVSNKIAEAVKHAQSNFTKLWFHYVNSNNLPRVTSLTTYVFIKQTQPYILKFGKFSITLPIKRNNWVLAELTQRLTKDDLKKDTASLKADNTTAETKLCIYDAKSEFSKNFYDHQSIKEGFFGGKGSTIQTSDYAIPLGANNNSSYYVTDTQSSDWSSGQHILSIFEERINRDVFAEPKVGELELPIMQNEVGLWKKYHDCRKGETVGVLIEGNNKAYDKGIASPTLSDSVSASAQVSQTPTLITMDAITTHGVEKDVRSDATTSARKSVSPDTSVIAKDTVKSLAGKFQTDWPGSNPSDARKSKVPSESATASLLKNVENEDTSNSAITTAPGFNCSNNGSGEAL